MMFEAEKVVSWNCRGAAGREFLVQIREIIREFRPKILIIIEPRISGATADKVCKSLGKKWWIGQRQEA